MATPAWNPRHEVIHCGNGTKNAEEKKRMNPAVHVSYYTEVRETKGKLQAIRYFFFHRRLQRFESVPVCIQVPFVRRRSPMIAVTLAPAGAFCFF